LTRVEGARRPKTFVGHYKTSELARRPIWHIPMIDVAVLAIGAAFFVALIACLYACDVL
jgi:hypothetical protein